MSVVAHALPALHVANALDLVTPARRERVSSRHATNQTCGDMEDFTLLRPSPTRRRSVPTAQVNTRQNAGNSQSQVFGTDYTYKIF
jgi:hypothetical protein